MPTSLSNRYLYPYIKEDISSKMIFLGGPRQVGKTTLAVCFLKPPRAQRPNYLNWDILVDKKIIKAGTLDSNSKIIVLDEIHKFIRWRNLVKGFYDEHFPRKNFIVTGSARLDYFNRGGDSLHGRYHYYRLAPFSVMELSSKPTQKDLEQLLEFGGFPEPLFRGSKTFWRRWQLERMQRIIQEDIRDLEKVRELSLMELLLDLLPARVGSPLSVNSLREDLEVSQQTVQRWLSIFDNMYVTFRISPFGAPKIRAVKKEQKLYFWDWSQIKENPGARFENLVAMQLLKYCHLVQDTQGYIMELRFIRDFDKREIDFVVLQNKKPLFAVECKTGEKALSPHINYFKERTTIPEFYQVHTGSIDRGNPSKGGRILPFSTFCKELGMP
jgi:uncharacterized protein